jgi:hypothetical protein
VTSVVIPSSMVLEACSSSIALQVLIQQCNRGPNCRPPISLDQRIPGECVIKFGSQFLRRCRITCSGKTSAAMARTSRFGASFSAPRLASRLLPRKVARGPYPLLRPTYGYDLRLTERGEGPK